MKNDYQENGQVYRSVVCGWPPLLRGNCLLITTGSFFRVGDLYNDDESNICRSDATWSWKRIDCILICFTSDQSCRCSSRRVDLSGEKLDKNFDESFVPGKA